MAQPETGGVETPSDDEEITIPSQDSADIRNVDIRGEQSDEKHSESAYFAKF